MDRGNRALRFAVTGALLAAPLAFGCGEDERVYVNEPAPPVNEPVHTVNEPAEPPGPVVPEENVAVERTNEPAQNEAQ